MEVHPTPCGDPGPLCLEAWPGGGRHVGHFLFRTAVPWASSPALPQRLRAGAVPSAPGRGRHLPDKARSPQASCGVSAGRPGSPEQSPPRVAMPGTACDLALRGAPRPLRHALRTGGAGCSPTSQRVSGFQSGKPRHREEGADGTCFFHNHCSCRYWHHIKRRRLVRALRTDQAGHRGSAATTAGPFAWEHVAQVPLAVWLTRGRPPVAVAACTSAQLRLTHVAWDFLASPAPAIGSLGSGGGASNHLQGHFQL